MLHRLSTAVAALTAKARRKKRQSPLPWLWVLSDAARLIDVSSIIAALPPGVGIIVRHPDPGLALSWQRARCAPEDHGERGY